ncbi:AMP-binding protein [Gaiella sp.]|uniref:AMP-binding protein n=1 Tax=Gaiella sp. TaxID=2663207 RepID=UPI002C691DFF|nr:AMP-binding protein [Gaiella sp.]HWO80145.1 AMP-binding protein [Gaiella sp.]
MALLRRRTKVDIPHAGPYAPGWEVPAHFNFTRDVVDTLAADPARSALTFVDREGIVDRKTFHEISGDAARWAHLLRTRLDRGDRVLFAIGKVPAWHGAMLGALKSGLVSVPSPDMLRARDLAFRVHHSGARLVVADRSLEQEIEEMRHQVGANVSVLYLDDALEELRRYMPVAPTEDTMAGETALILYTSGTTKDPKGVVHTHAYTWAQRAQATHWLDAHDGDVVWCTAGTGWAKAIWNSLLGPWSHGAEIVLHEGPFDAEERLSLIQRLGVTILCQAPTEYRMLAKLENLGAAHLPRLRHAVSAGEPLNPEVIARFQDALGITVHDGYGQTENSLLVANPPGAPLRPGSMGVPTPGHDVAVIDDSGHVCPPGVEGDLALIGRPPTLFVGYWDAPEESEAMFRDGWYLTGDRAVRDEDGYLWFVGRSDDVILSAAYRIGPFEVESALLEHPAVAESGVVGVPDLDRGQIVKAFVVLRPGHEPGDRLARELQEHVKAVTAPYKYPRAITFVEELPKTSSGKIRRSELRRLNDELGVASPRMTIVPDAPEADEAAEVAAAEEAARVAAAAAAEAAAERDRAAAVEAARREAAAAAERALAEAEERARREAEDAARIEAESAERERARVEAETAERARAEAEQAEAAERARAEAAAAAAAAERARREAEEAELARAEAEAAEQARREAEEAERVRAEAEAWARIAAAEEAAARLEAEAQEQVALVEATEELDEQLDHDELDEDELDQDELGSAEVTEGKESRGDARRRRRAEKAEAKRQAEEERRLAKEAEEQRKRDEAAAREEAKRRAEDEKVAAKQRAEDEKRRAVEEKEAATRRAEEERVQAKLDAEQRKRQEAAAREAEKAAAKQAAEDERRRQAEEREQARLAEEEERRRQRDAAKAQRGGLGRLFKREQHDEYEDEDETPAAPIPDIVERLKVYSRDAAEVPAPEESAVAPEIGEADAVETVGDDQPPATRTAEGE